MPFLAWATRVRGSYDVRTHFVVSQRSMLTRQGCLRKCPQGLPDGSGRGGSHLQSWKKPLQTKDRSRVGTYLLLAPSPVFFFFSSRHLKVKLLTTSRLDASVSPSYSKRERHRAYLHYQSNAMVPSFLHQNFNKKIFFAHAIRQTKDDFARTMLQFPMALLRTTAWPSI